MNRGNRGNRGKDGRFSRRMDERIDQAALSIRMYLWTWEICIPGQGLKDIWLEVTW